jgi:Ca-activated chloride channel homolog
VAARREGTNRNTMRLLSLLALMVVAAVSVQGQQEDRATAPGAGNTLSVKVRVVAINALVRDKKERLVGGLEKDAFTLSEDGKPQTIKYFDRYSDLPLTIGLMVDTSGSQRDYAEEERKASATFLQSMITKPEDRAFVERFDSYVLLLQKMTPDVELLEHGLSLLGMHVDPPKGSNGGTLLFDAVFATAEQVVSKEPGRRAIVVLTDGDDNGSAHSIGDAIREAQLADVAVYSVMYTREPVGYVGSTARPSGIHVMDQISKATGGRLYVVGRGMSIQQIYAAIEADLRTQYRIGYTPPPAPVKSFHSLDLRTVDKHMSVQARTGYFTPE